MRNETVYLTASGDLRLAANRVCWPAQQALETALVQAVEAMGYTVDRRPAFDADKGHGFLDSQRMGLGRTGAGCEQRACLPVRSCAGLMLPRLVRRMFRNRTEKG